MVSMKCIFEKELEDRQLLAYLDHEADQETVHHLEQCAYCLERANALARLHDRLTENLYRVKCPSSIELGEYHLRILPASQMMIISQHLRICPHCANEFAQFSKNLMDPMQQSGPLGPVRVLIANLIRGSSLDHEGGELLTPSFANLRGEAEEPLVYQADHVQIVLEVQEDPELLGHKILLGLVTGQESNDIYVRISKEGKVFATTLIDEFGNFVIHHLVSGIYQLILIGANIEIRIKALSI